MIKTRGRPKKMKPAAKVHVITDDSPKMRISYLEEQLKSSAQIIERTLEHAIQIDKQICTQNTLIAVYKESNAFIEKQHDKQDAFINKLLAKIDLLHKELLDAKIIKAQSENTEPAHWLATALKRQRATLRPSADEVNDLLAQTHQSNGALNGLRQ